MIAKNLIWVIGEGGMLGSHLTLALPSQGFKIFSSKIKLNWSDQAELFSQIKEVFNKFLNEAPQYQRWTIFWAAGKSNMLSSDLEVSKENEIFNFFVQLIKAQYFLPKNGVLAVASSAGAIYAESPSSIVSESSPTGPNCPYALAKLQQENLLMDLSSNNSGIHAAIFRLSTLYGNRYKGFNRQGLIGSMAQKILNCEEIEFFVPLSTRRDFIHVEDAALLVSKILKNMDTKPSTFIKIVAAERTYSIEDILDVFRIFIKHPIKFRCSTNDFSKIYSKNIEFRSNVFVDLEGLEIRDLHKGVNDLLSQLSSPPEDFK